MGVKVKLDSEKDLKLMANTIRSDIIRMLMPACSGHTAGPLGLAELFAYLFFSEMKYDPKKPNWAERDRFVLSNGHVCPVLYSAMARVGYFDISETLNFRKLGSRFQGHPSKTWLPGIENSSGPLGQGLSVACGMAFSAKCDNKNWRIYCMTSDGEHQEGNTWESVMFAAKYRLDNLVAVCDRNYIQIDGQTEDVMPLGDLEEKYRSFGWNAVTINGHDFSEIKKAFENAKRTKGKPTMIIAKTVPGKGVSFMENKYQWHGKPPCKDEGELALNELGEERKSIMRN